MLHRASVDQDRTGLGEGSVLEIGAEIEQHLGARVECQLRSEQVWRARLDRRGRAQQRSDEHAYADAGQFHRLGNVVGEVVVGEAGGIRQCVPELHAVQHGGVGSADLLVGDATAGDHQVQLAGEHSRIHSVRVEVVDAPGEQPGDSREPGVRVPGHLHPAGVGDVVGSVVVEKAPSADQGALLLRQRAVHRHGADAAQRYLARGEHLDIRAQLPGLEKTLGRVAFLVAHAAPRHPCPASVAIPAARVPMPALHVADRGEHHSDRDADSKDDEQDAVGDQRDPSGCGVDP
ncbi:hypothetical protein GCM10025863_11060 [Microbacterium suwonense]|uniref:Uncharacterized protein n=1 Tax=Microbacterium suwonense TaxID=683047 RepID=A0ABM8FS45_9MICO|nr:hypothetical protein GCM10025863_11060 [Microbacterium suwonense]